MTCNWKADEDGIYATGCHQLFWFDSGDIAENKFAFCPYCGQQIIESKSDEISEPFAAKGQDGKSA